MNLSNWMSSIVRRLRSGSKSRANSRRRLPGSRFEANQNAIGRGTPDILENRTLLTTISIVGNEIVVADSSGGGADNDWLIEADGTNLTVTSRDGSPIDLQEPLDGGAGNGTSSASILLSNSYTGIKVDPRGGNDIVTIGDLTLLHNQSFQVNEGTGADVANIIGDVILTGTGAASINASRNIVVTSGAGISTDSGTITLAANSAGGGRGTFVGVLVVGADISSVDGKITINGTGGDARDGNKGVSIVSSRIRTIGDGEIDIDGKGLLTTLTKNSHGVFISGSDTLISTINADINILGNGRGTGTATAGVMIFNDAVVESTGTGNINITASGVAAATGINISGRIGVARSPGALTLTTDEILLTSDADLKSRGGNLIIKPRNVLTGIALGANVADSGLQLDDGELSKLSSLPSVTIGDIDNGTGPVAIRSGSVFSMPVTIVGGSISVTGLDAGASSVTLIARTGSITDGGSGQSDIIAGDFAFDAANGVGPNGALEINVERIAGDGGTGSVKFDRSGGTRNTEIGSVGNFTGITTVNAGVDISINGTLTVNESVSTAGGDIEFGNSVRIPATIDINANLTSGGGDVITTAKGDIHVTADIDSGGGNITLNADSDALAAPGGGITLENAVVTSSGGDIVLGGGADPLTTPVRGAIDGIDTLANNGVGIGIAMVASTLSSGAGGISVRGSGSEADGIDLVGASGVSSRIISTTGSITVVGEGNGPLTSSAAVNVAGASKIETDGGSIAITANGRRGNSIGLRLSESSFGSVVSTGGGSINIEATGFGNGTGIKSTGASNVIGGPIAKGPLTLVTDSYEVTGSVESTGPLTIKPLTAGTTIGLGNSATGQLNLTPAELGSLGDGFSAINIGDPTAGDIDVNSVSFKPPVTIAGDALNIGGLTASGNAITLQSGDVSTLGGVSNASSVLLASGRFHVITLTASSVTVADGATLGGNGAVNADVTVNEGGTVAPGTSAGRLTVSGDVTFSPGSVFKAEIDGVDAGSEYDQLRVTGALRQVDLNDAQIVLSGSHAGDPEDFFTLVEMVDDTSTLLGTFFDLPEGDGVSVGGTPAIISYGGNDVRISAPFVIGNRVWEDRNQNGLQDADEPGIENVTVRLLDATGTTTLQTTTTDNNGLYSFEGSVLDTYLVEFVAPPAHSFTLQNEQSNDQIDSDVDPATGRVSITLTTGNAETDGVDAGMIVDTSLAAIGDTVFRDDNGNGLQDVGEPGLEAITVRLLDAGFTTVDTQLTDSTGHYDFQGLLPGTWYVEFDLLPGFNFSDKDQGAETVDSDANPGTGRTAPIGLTASQINIDIDAGMQPLTDQASIGNRVWNDLNGNGIQDPAERGVADVVVELRDSAGTTLLQTTKSGDAGDYLFQGLTAGDYQVHVFTPYGYKITSRDQGSNDSRDSDISAATGRAAVALATNENQHTLDIGLTPLPETGTIGGQVWEDIDADGKRDGWESPLANATVTLLNSAASAALRQTQTSAEGTYRFDALPAGDYQLQFAAPGGRSFTLQDVGDDSVDSDVNPSTGVAAVSLAAGERQFSTFAGLQQLSGLGTITGRIWTDLNEDGIRDVLESNVRPAGETRVYLYDSTGTRFIGTSLVDETGRYQFNGLASGSYEVRTTIPQGYLLTLRQQGADVTTDSDFLSHSNIGKTTVIVSGNEIKSGIDGGFKYGSGFQSIKGTIWNDVHPDGQRKNGESREAGVDLRLLDETGRQLLQSTTTDANGDYRFSGLSASFYLIEVTPPTGHDFTLQNTGSDDFDSDIDPETGLIAVTITGSSLSHVDAGLVTVEAATISGRVFDDDNDGLRESGENGLSEAVTVRLRDAAGTAVIASTTTSSDGSYQFTGLEAGTYFVEFDLPAGYSISPQNQGSDDSIDSDPDASGRVQVAVQESQHLTTLDAGLFYDTSTASIEGSVWDDHNGDGIQNVTEPGLNGVVVRLLDESGVNYLATTTTVNGGQYRFGGLDSGNYVVEFVEPAGFQLTVPNQGGDDEADSDADTTSGRAAVAIASGAIDTSIDAGFVTNATGSIAGRIFYDTDGDGVRESGESYRDSNVDLYDSSGVNLIDTTKSSNSQYSFQGLAAGAYILRFRPVISSDGFSPSNVGSDDSRDSDPDSSGQVTVVLAENEQVDDVDAGLRYAGAMGRVNGLVWHDSNRDGIRSGESMYSGFLVRLLDSTASRVVATTETNTSGAYTLNAAAGSYFVQFLTPSGRFFSPQHASLTTHYDSDADPATGLVSVTITSNRTVNNIDAGVLPVSSGKISGQAWHDIDANGTRGTLDPKLTEVHVYLKDVSGRILRTATTNMSAARYTFEIVPAGTYNLHFSAPSGYLFTAQNVGSEFRDSDVDATGVTSVTVTQSGTRTVDAGFVTASTAAYIGGTVFNDVNQDGQRTSGTEPGVADAQVALFNAADGRFLKATTTSRTGEYRFDGLTKGKSYRVRFEEKGGFTFSPQDVGVDRSDSDVDAQGFVTVTTGNIIVERHTDAGMFHASGSIGDRVWEDRNGNGVQDPGEPGLADVTVELHDESFEFLRSTTTDAAGFYSFGFSDDEGTGDYTVRVQPPVGFEFTTQNQGADDGIDSDAEILTGQADLSFVGGTVVSDLDFGLVRNSDQILGSISNRVWNDVNGDGDQDAGEPGLAGVTVLLIEPATQTVLTTTTTNEDGLYSFRGIQAGSYTLEFLAPTGFDVTGQNLGGNDTLDSDIDTETGRVTINLTESEHNTNVDAGFVTRTTGNVGLISDRVWNDRNGDGIQQGGEPGLRGVTVRLRLAAGGSVLATTQTDDSGIYAFPGLGATDYFVEVIPTGGFDFSAKDQGNDDTVDSDFDPETGFSDVIELTASTQITNLDAGLTLRTTGDTALISNRVFEDVDGDGIQDTGEAGLANVVVRLMDADATFVVGSTTTDADGNYAFRGLSANDYLIEVVPPIGYSISPQDEGGDDGLDSDVDPILGRSDTITLSAGQQLDTIDAGLIDTAPTRVLVHTGIGHIIPGEDPDGGGSFVSFGRDAFISIDDAHTAIDSLPDSTVVVLNGETFDAFTLDRAGRISRFDATATDAAFSSLTIDVGTFALDAGSLQVVGGVSVNDGGTLGGSGTVDGSVNVNSGGTVAPGRSPGILAATGDVTFADGSSFRVEIGGATAGEGAGNHDQLDAGGSVTIGAGVTLDLAAFDGGLGNDFSPSDGDKFVIIRRDGGSGAFAGLPEAASIPDFLGSEQTAVITYMGGDGDDVELLFDHTAPTVEISRQTPAAEQTNADSVTFLVNFDEAVSNVDASDFEVAAPGATSGTITVSDNDDSDPSTFAVTVASVGGDGALNLDFAAAEDIVDRSGSRFDPETDVASEESYIIDNTAPVFENSTPTVTALEADRFTLNVQLNEPGNTYYVVVANDAPTPSAVEIMSGQAAGGEVPIISGTLNVDTAGVNSVAEVVGLMHSTAYDVYVVAEDAAANLQMLPQKVAVTTPLPSLTLSVERTGGFEADTTQLVASVTTNSPVTGRQKVEIIINGTGVTDRDLSASSATIIIPDGKSTGIATFTIVDDAQFEDLETVVLRMVNPSNGVSLGSEVETSFTITDNDTNVGPEINVEDLIYTEDQDDGDSVQIDASASLSDPNGDEDWTGGTLTVQITEHSESGDQLSIAGDVSGSIRVDKSGVKSGSQLIGTLTRSSGQRDLTVTFNEHATNALVQDVLRAVSYRTTSDTPSELDRTVTFTATDKHGSSGSDTAVISVTATNDPASVRFGKAATTTLAEGTDTSSAIKLADVIVSDPDEGENALSLGGDDEAFFNLVGTELFLLENTVLDFESKPSYSLTVSVDDANITGTPDATVPFTLSIVDVNEPPVVQAHRQLNQLLESTILNNNLRVADIVVVDDALGSNDLSLSGTDASFFELQEGQLQLKKGTPLDFETKPFFNVTVEVNDSELPGNPDSSVSLTLQILDVFETARAALSLNGVDVRNGQTVSFGEAALNGESSTRLFALSNTGSADLILQPIAVPLGFRLTSENFEQNQVLQPGDSTTFSVEMRTDVTGTRGGQLSFRSNDQGSPLQRLQLSGAVIVAATEPTPLGDGSLLIDNGDTGYTESGQWRDVLGYGYDRNAEVAANSNGSSRAIWAFGNLEPGQYDVSITWLNGSDRSEQVPVVIRDGVGGPALSTIHLNQRKAPDGPVIGGRRFQILDTVIITGDTLMLELSNEGSSKAVIADAVMIRSVTPPPNTPDITVRDSNGSIADGSTFNFAASTVEDLVSQEFTIRNDGTADLTLQPIELSNESFSLTTENAEAGQVLEPGDQFTFSIAVNTAGAGTFNATLTLPSNDPDESPFVMGLAATVREPGANVFFVDDGSPDFKLTGNWLNVPNYGYQRDAKAISPNRTGTATWTFTGLDPGEYSVATTWLNGSDRGSSVPYVIRDGIDGEILATVPVDQRKRPNGMQIEGREFASLGTVTIQSETLVVELSNTDSDGAVIADAVRIESFVPAPNTPEVTVKAGTATVLDEGRFNLGSIEQGEASLVTTFVVRNTGTAPLILYPIDVSGDGFSLTSEDFSPGQTLNPNEEVTFRISLRADALGTFNGSVSFRTNDGDENPFNFDVTGSIKERLPEGVHLIDNGDTGFSQSGNWADVTNYGFDQDALAGNGINGEETARWEFTNLVAGTYEVSTTWLRGGDRDKNVPYVIRDGVTNEVLANVSVDQTKNPADAVYGKRPFQVLGTVEIRGSKLVVELSTLGTTKAAIADAVRIELVEQGP